MEHNDWKESQFYDDGHTEYTTYIGGHRVMVVQIVDKLHNIPNHWGYSIKHRDGFYTTGHRFPWSADRAKTFVVVTLALRALARVLRNQELRECETWVDEDTLDRL